MVLCLRALRSPTAHEEEEVLLGSEKRSLMAQLAVVRTRLAAALPDCARWRGGIQELNFVPLRHARCEHRLMRRRLNRQRSSLL